MGKSSGSRRARPRLAFSATCFSFSVFAVVVVAASSGACGGNDARPDAGSGFVEGGPAPDVNVTSRDASDDGKTADAADGDGAVVPSNCSNGFKDGNETDSDCGGNECEKCVDDKACVADTDCAGGSCVNKICTTASCKDNVKNALETDVDCGGGKCAKCTIGRACKAGTDCVSGSCVNNACRCPQGMESVSKNGGGGAYCIDGAEVTKGQYNKFITANYPLANQSAVCQAENTSFVPRGAWPPATTPPALIPNGLPFNLSLPVHYVDWCDADSYCKWAGKQLCGLVDGGAVNPGDGNDANKSAWFNACTAQNANLFPYGNSYLAGKCNGQGATNPNDVGPKAGLSVIGRGYGYAVNQDEDIFVVTESDVNGNFTVYDHAECQGGVTGVYQMSGNVGEWEDSCDSTVGSANCKIRGGSYTAEGDPAKLRCDAQRSLQRVPSLPAEGQVDPLADVGFRCCSY